MNYFSYNIPRLHFLFPFLSMHHLSERAPVHAHFLQPPIRLTYSYLRDL